MSQHCTEPSPAPLMHQHLAWQSSILSLEASPPLLWSLPLWLCALPLSTGLLHRLCQSSAWHAPPAHVPLFPIWVIPFWPPAVVSLCPVSCLGPVFLLWFLGYRGSHEHTRQSCNLNAALSLTGSFLLALFRAQKEDMSPENLILFLPLDQSFLNFSWSASPLSVSWPPLCTDSFFTPNSWRVQERRRGSKTPQIRGV